jgi:hypothetical protein
MDFGTALPYYTCVFDYRGGTYVRQFPKEDFPGGIVQAVTEVLNLLENPMTNPSEQAHIAECWRDLVTITGMHGVWYTSFLVHDDLFLVHVVRQ